MNETCLSVVSLLSGLCLSFAHASEPYRVEVVDKASGWPVPLVELRTTHGARFVTDNAGLIAIDSPELLGRETWFHVDGHGYEVPVDGFGYRGVRLTPIAGGLHRIDVVRTMIARRVGRLTGAGMFAESQKLGLHLEWKESGVFGCDSVQAALHQGKLFWAWGDTSFPNYPLGVFDMTSATTDVPSLPTLQPPLKLVFDYFRDENGRPRGVAKMPGQGPTWVSAYVSLPDRTGASRLVGTYIKVQNYLDAYECGLCVWDGASNSFHQERVLWTKSEEIPERPPVPDGHPVFHKDTDGKEWVYFGNPLPTLRCPASFEAWQNPDSWQVLRAQDTLADAGGGEPVKPHSGSIAWNPFRKRWVTVFMQALGKPSGFGELWYAEARHLDGPWGPAVKVLTHQNYTFYNPRLHSEFTPSPESEMLFFEGTYTAEFADKPQVTPRYNYNQILYRLDLNDPALKPAWLPGGVSP